MGGILESKGWKNLVAKAYGIGAAIVITGALFKIMHFPYSGLILTIGMAVEAGIFFISAFEPLPKEYHWENVYPEVVGGSGLPAPVQGRQTSYGGAQPSFSSNFNLDVDKSVTEDLKTGLKKLSESVGQMNNLSMLVDAASELTGKMHMASGAVMGVSESAGMLADSYHKNTQTIQHFNDQAKTGLEQMHSGYEFYRGQLETLGRTLGALNSSYELYLQESKRVQNDYTALHGEMQQLISGVSVSVSETQRFGSQIASLNNNVANLNSIYGSMLTAVSSVLNKQ
jgi:gliding motility-associated protein GldL